LNTWAYKILKTKGRGGYADVHKAKNLFTGQIVALKELRRPNAENRRRFKRESDLLAIYADSPYFPDLYQSVLECDEPYLVMEYSSTGSLQQFVGNLTDWRRGARWLIDIARALEAMEQRGDMHRDLKPGNMLLYPRSEGGEIVKLIDFGLAHRPDNPSGPATNSVYGTKGYIDPVAEKTGVFFKQADIYSVGRSMRAIFTGSPDGSLFRMIPGPVQFRNLIESMISLDITRRPTPRQIYEATQRLLTVHEKAPIQLPNIDWGTAAKWGLGALALLALLKPNSWDENAQRYRNSKGQFASGWL
jgi:serine/threonine protein kinase